MGAVEEYRKRRADRLRERGVRSDAKETPHVITRFQDRRDMRLAGKGFGPAEKRFRLDADGDEESNNNKKGGGGGGHGNTRLPFGLCKRFGIEIGTDWTPKDAWEALAGKGITADGAYKALEEGRDPGTPDAAKVPDPPKEPVKTLPRGAVGYDAEYEGLKGAHVSWDRSFPWELTGKRVGEGGPGYTPSYLSISYETKEDMLWALKDAGVEEFEDPETGELLNPKEMELPTRILKIGRTGYSEVTMGYRKDAYVLIGTRLDGKKRELKKFRTVERAKEWYTDCGGNSDDIKLSPALKKREKERTAWMSSDKKEYIEVDGVKYGDIRIRKSDFGGCMMVAESERGELKRKEMYTRAEVLQFLKDQGVEVVREGKEVINPQEFEMPKVVAEINDMKFTEVGFKTDSGRASGLAFYGIDIDGVEHRIGFRRRSETLIAYKERLAREYGLTEDDMTISDEAREVMAEIEKQEEEQERRRKEFEQRAVDIPGLGKYADLHIRKGAYGYRIFGSDRDGAWEDLTSYGDLYDMDRYAEKFGLNIDDLLKDDAVREQYAEYLEARQSFDRDAVKIGPEKYTDVSIRWSGYDFSLVGKDFRGRDRTIRESDDIDGIERALTENGLTIESFPMDERAKERYSRIKKVKEAVESGEYFTFGKTDDAYKDIQIKPHPSRGWLVFGTDLEGSTYSIEGTDTWDEALDLMDRHGVGKYKMFDKDGNEMKEPTYGMRHVILMKRSSGGYVVFADTKRFGKHEIMYETPKEEDARKWLKENGVPADELQTRRMNPNDEVPREHSAKSLDNFDVHRIERAEKISMLRTMSEATKEKTAEMLTEMFDKGAYRINRRGNFKEIVLGRFKCLLETHTSGGSSYEPGRRETGVKTFGHDYNIKPEDGEKYGYWGRDDDASEVLDSVAGGYGGISFKLRKDRVGERTTYTFGDSLDAGRPLAGYAGKYPTIEGVSGLRSGWNLNEMLEHYDQYKKGEIDFNELHDRISNDCQDGYVECQFHGELTIEDVETVTMKRYKLEDVFSHMNPTDRKAVVDRLTSCGVALQYIDDLGVIQDGYKLLQKKYGV